MRGIPTERILKLTATSIGNGEPYEPYDRWPTYENMVSAFRQITEVAQPSDQIYIHYSGHGGRTKTMLPSLKRHGIDEALVPANIGLSDARYLRDVEMAYLLQEMVKKGLLVTLVLDCCHSGGLTRREENNIAVRGLGTIDTTPRPQESLVASEEDLARIWHNATGSSGWLPKQKGYVLLAACLSYEKAYEFAFDGKQKNGALTYWLLDALKQTRSGLTYKHLHDRIMAKVHAQFRRQTPQLEGDSSRVVFADEHVQGHYAVTLLRTDIAKKRVLLNTGQVHPLGQDAQFALYPRNTGVPNKEPERLALASISQLGATDSWATIIQQLSTLPIESGAQAVLLDPGESHFRGRVKLLHQDFLPPTIDQDKALESLEVSLAESGTGFVQVIRREEPADYKVNINSYGEYVIKNGSGQDLPNMRPALRINDPRSPSSLVQRLVHLTKYHNIQSISNSDPQSPLKGKLEVELLGKQSNYDPGDQPNPQPFSTSGNIPRVYTGEWLFVRICNNASYPLNISALDMQPDWSITQIPLYSGDIYFMSFDPSQMHVLPLQLNLPPDYRTGRICMKFFGTVGTTSFRWLELPPLDQPPRRVRSHDKLDTLTNVIKQIFLAAIVPEESTQELGPAVHPSWEWITTQIEILVDRHPL
jgi:hypothetical protein